MSRFVVANSRRPRWLAALAAATVIAAGVVLPAQAAVAAVPAPIVIDDFSGNVTGTRTVAGSAGGGLSVAPTFMQSGGVGTITVNGTDNSVPQVDLTYDYDSPIDLTSMGTNTQFLIDFAEFKRAPEDGQTVANIVVTVTDADGTSGSYSTGVATSGALNIPLQFSCATTPGAPCFDGNAKFTKISKIIVSVIAPRNYDPTHSNTVKIDRIRTSPTGQQPPRPTPAISLYGVDANGVLWIKPGDTIRAKLTFTANGQPVGIDPWDLLSVTASGIPGAAVMSMSTGSSLGTFNVGIPGAQGAGTLTINVAEGAGEDIWGQRSLAASASFTVKVATLAEAKTFTPTVVVDEPLSISVGRGDVPTASYELIGDLPQGLSFNPATGLITGSAITASGSSVVSIKRTNPAGSATDKYTLTPTYYPTFSGQGALLLRAGTSGETTFTVDGSNDVTLSSPVDWVTIEHVSETVWKLKASPPVGAEDANVRVVATNRWGPATHYVSVLPQHDLVLNAPVTLVKTLVGGTTLVPFELTGSSITSVWQTPPAWAGITFLGNGPIMHAPDVAGTYTLNFSATNPYGSPPVSTSITFIAGIPPTVTADSSPGAGQIGEQFTQGITTTGYPAPVVSATGLPAGLAVQQLGSAHTITGTPTQSGSFTASITATNDFGASNVVTVPITINEAPELTSATAFTVYTGDLLQIPVTVSGYPAPVVAVGALPAGLTFDPVSGTINGAVARPGTYDVSVTLTNVVSVQTRTIRITAIQGPPVMTSANALTLALGETADFTVTASGTPSPTFQVTGLPAGLSFVDNGDGSGTITGVAEEFGRFEVQIEAENSRGTDSQTLVLEVTAPPVFTSNTQVDAVVGQPVSFDVTTAAWPFAALSATNVPAGLTFVDNRDGTATLSGTPTSGGVFTVAVTAENVFGAVPADLTVTILEAPAVVGAYGVTLQLGESFESEFTATGFPAPILSATGLPDGVTFDGEKLAGKPTAAGDFVVKITAKNSVSTATHYVWITVNKDPEFTSASNANFEKGVPGSFTITAGGYPIPALSLTGSLPAGLSFVDNEDGTARISGTPTAAGTFVVTVTARAGAPVSLRSFAAALADDAISQDITIVVAGDEVAGPGTGGPGTGGPGTGGPDTGGPGAGGPGTGAGSPKPGAKPSPALPVTGVDGSVGWFVGLGAVMFGLGLILRRRRRAS